MPCGEWLHRVQTGPQRLDFQAQILALYLQLQRYSRHHGHAPARVYLGCSRAAWPSLCLSLLGSMAPSCRLLLLGTCQRLVAARRKQPLCLATAFGKGAGGPGARGAQGGSREGGGTRAMLCRGRADAFESEPGDDGAARLEMIHRRALKIDAGSHGINFGTRPAIFTCAVLAARSAIRKCQHFRMLRYWSLA